MGLTEADVHAYYGAALVGLRYIEHANASQRRFGPNADAVWSSFEGDLTTADRLDLLIRDADAQWAGSFGARTVFAMEAVSEDDPFGPAWAPLGPVDAEELWRTQAGTSAPSSVAEALRLAAAAWQLEPAPTEAPSVGAADKLLVVGPGAIIAAAQAFADGTDLDWADQVTCIATSPAHRQLAAMAAALLGSSRTGTILTASAAAGIDLPVTTTVISTDADPADADAAGTASSK